MDCPALLVTSPLLLVLVDQRTPSHVSGGVLFLVVGFGLTAQCIAYLALPIRRVVAHGDGRFTFHTPRRQVDVGPGDVLSIRCWWPDPNRLLAMVLRTTESRLLIVPNWADISDLFSAVAAANPDAVIADPRSWLRLLREPLREMPPRPPDFRQ